VLYVITSPNLFFYKTCFLTEHKGILRIADIASRIIYLDSFTTCPLYPQGKNHWYPLDRRLDRSQSRSERRSEKKTSSLYRESSPRSSSQLIYFMFPRKAKTQSNSRHIFLIILIIFGKVTLNSCDKTTTVVALLLIFCEGTA